MAKHGGTKMFAPKIKLKTKIKPHGDHTVERMHRD